MWIIPTRMGTSDYLDSHACYLWDHPHAYGDKHIGIFEQGACQGSSPRVWGQGVYVDINTGDIRIIPTRMGTSRPRPAFLQGVWDHPHAYGDKSQVVQQ